MVGMAVVEVVEALMSVLVVLELSGLDDEVGMPGHILLSAVVLVEGVSIEGEDGREQSSTKRERRWAAMGVAMAIVDVWMRCLCISRRRVYQLCYEVICTIRAISR